MRLIAGFLAFLLLLSLSTASYAQVKGEVQSIGFGDSGYFRSTCWTPMVVRLTATTGAPYKGKIIVKQDDLDGDHVAFSRDFDLGGNPEGGSNTTERYWMYFRPQPTLTSNGPSLSRRELQRQLQVFVCDAGGKELLQLPITSDMTSLDDLSVGVNTHRGNKLLLCIVGDDKPQFTGYIDALGISEDLVPVNVSISNAAAVLPESPLGYEAVDAVVWCDADPQKLTARQRQTLEDYIRRGGRLIIVQTTRPVAWSAVSIGLGDLMPVDILQIARLKNLETFKKIQRSAIHTRFADADSTELTHRNQVLDDAMRDWDSLKGPFDYAVSTPRPGAVVEDWFDPASVPIASPFIVHKPYGLGTISWVGQDIADANLLQNDQTSDKWVDIWQRVFSWSGNPVPRGFLPDDRDKVLFGGGRNSAQRVLLSTPILHSMDLPGTGTALVGLAVLFFIIYWAAAGPGVHIVLAARKKSGLNWFAFALVAIIFTALTVGIVRLVLHGNPKAQHVTFVSIGPDGKAVVHSQFGLYVPHDGLQKIELSGNDSQPGSGNYIVPFQPPNSASLNTFNAHQDYEIPVMESAAVQIPYRSTLKKLQISWTGSLPGPDGAAALSSEGGVPITGKLVNRTGANLRNIYFIFNHPVSTDGSDNLQSRGPDTVLFVPFWDKDKTCDLKQEYKNAVPLLANGALTYSHSFRGPLNHSAFTQSGFDAYWFKPWRGSNYTDTELDEDLGDTPRCFPLLSLFSRLPVMAASNTDGRMELDRKGLRYLDASKTIAAGELLILAQSKGSFPIPIKVNGGAITADGATFYQFILPLDRSAYPSRPPALPATKPAATAPARAARIAPIQPREYPLSPSATDSDFAVPSMNRSLASAAISGRAVASPRAHPEN